MLILELWGISCHAVVVFGLGKNLLFKFILWHCAGTAAGHHEGTSPIIQLQFNNQKHNNPFLNDKQVCIIAILTFLIVGTILSFHFYNDFIGQCKVLNLATKEFLYRVLFLEPIVFKVITPIMYLIQRKDARSFFRMTIEDIICR